MSKSLAELQTLCRFHARDDQLDLTTTEGLAITNYLYRRLIILHSWPEFTREDVSVTTTAGIEEYNWPSSPVFMDLTKVEMQDSEDDLKYKLIPAARTGLEFTQERGKKASFPTVYRRMYDGSNHSIQFAPAPKEASLIVRITGTVEPTELTAGASTQFLSEIVDDALSLMISAEIMNKRNFPDHAQRLLVQASEMLQQTAGKSIVPSEITGA